MDVDGRESHRQFYLPTVKIKDYNVMINGRNFFDQPIKNDLKTYNNTRKIVTGQVMITQQDFYWIISILKNVN